MIYYLIIYHPYLFIKLNLSIIDKFEMEDETIRLLINKIENGLPDIKLRSIATLYTKVTLGIIEHTHLPRYVNLPGVLLQWINDNKSRNQSLFKVLTIFTYFTKSQQGLLLLKEYEAKDFFEEYKQFLLGQQPRHDQYTDLLDNIIRQLLPISNNAPNQQQHKPPPTKPPKQQKPKPTKQKQVYKQGVKMSWIVVRNQLEKIEEDEIYSLMMELRHSKKQLQLQWLNKIQSLVKYWGYKWFRFRIDLINQLTQQLTRTPFAWLIIDILTILVRGIGQSCKSLANEELLLLNLSGGKLISVPETQKISITLKSQVFDNIYSFQLIEELIKYNQYAKETNLLQNLVELNFKHSPKYFITSLQTSLKQPPISINLDAVTKNIQYYCSSYDHFAQRVSKILLQAPQEWSLKPQKFSILKEHMEKAQKRNSFNFISMYKSQWNIGNNLHNIVEVMSNLQQGVVAIDQENSNHYVGLYLNSLLTLAVAVQRQDPLMAYYPLMKSLIVKIAKNPSLRPTLFQKVLSLVESASAVRYGSKQFSSADLSILSFSQASMFKEMFFESFGDEKSLQYWLQVALILGKKSHQFCELSSYACIFHTLTYHKQEKVKNIAKKLVQSLDREGKQKVIVCRLFSKSQQQRLKISIDLFGDNHENVLGQLQTKVQAIKLSKKPLKISENSIENYMQIIFNKTIEEQIRLNAAKELLQSLQRIQLNKNIEQLLNLLSDSICKSLNQADGFSQPFLSLFIQMNGVLNNILQEKYYLKIQNTIKLLQCPLPSKAVQILLEHLFTSSFQTPFSLQKQIHFSALLYPHLSYVDMKVSGYIQNQSQMASKPAQFKKNSASLYENVQSFSHLIEWLMFAQLNEINIKLDQRFVNIVEKEIGCILHASKGYSELHYLAYGFSFIGRKRLVLPDKIFDYSSPLLNILLAKDQSNDNCEPIASIITVIGCKKSRQLNSLLLSNPQGLWKYSILMKMDSIEGQLIDLIIKGLLGIGYGKQAVLILRLVLGQSSRTTFSKLSQTLIINSCIKYMRQETDELLRKTAICVATELYNKVSCEGRQDMFSSAISIFLQHKLTLSISRMLLSLIKVILQKNQSVLIKEANIIKIFIGKMVALLSIASVDWLTAAIIFQIINVIGLKNRSFLQDYQLVDTSIILIGKACQKNSFDDYQAVRLVQQIIDYLSLQCSADKDLSKYLLTSTNLLKNIVNICKTKSKLSPQLLQSMGRIMMTLSQQEQDLFVYKTNLIVKTQISPFINILASHVEGAGLNYLKMIGWIMVIWLRNRQDLDPTVGEKIASVILNSQQPNLIKSIMPFSIKSKILFLSSKYVERLIKENNQIIDERLVKESKEKKKKGKIYQLGQKQFVCLNQFLCLLSSLFYWSQSAEEQIKQTQGLKKILIFIEKMYGCGEWDDQITKSYLKVITNMALSQPFASICSNRLSQNAIMVEDIIKCVSKSQNSDGTVKLSLKLMSLLVHFQSIRSTVLRARVIEQLTSKLIRGQQRGQLNLQHTMDIVQLFLSFSAYKDSNIRLLNDKKVLEVLLRIIKLGKFSLLEEKIIFLLSNLACFKTNKSTFMSNREIHKIILGLLEDPQISYHSAILSLLYNILYKNSAGLKLYRRPQVIQVIKNIVVSNESDVSKVLMEALVSDQSN